MCNNTRYINSGIETYLFNAYNCYFMFFLGYFPGFGNLVVHFASTEHQLMDSFGILCGYSSFWNNPLELGVSNHFIKRWPGLWETKNGLGAHINQLKKIKVLKYMHPSLNKPSSLCLLTQLKVTCIQQIFKLTLIGFNITNSKLPNLQKVPHLQLLGYFSPAEKHLYLINFQIHSYWVSISHLYLFSEKTLEIVLWFH